jgi:hypothetical protein
MLRYLVGAYRYVGDTYCLRHQGRRLSQGSIFPRFDGLPVLMVLSSRVLLLSMLCDLTADTARHSCLRS